MSKNEPVLTRTRIFSGGQCQLGARIFLGRIWAHRSGKAYACTFALRNDHISSLGQLNDTLNVAGQVDASPLTAGFGFDDESLSLALLTHFVVGLELVVVLWEVPSHWEEIILLGKSLPEVHERVAQIVLPRKYGHPCVKCVLPGKWFIFWWGCILANSSFLTWLSVQQISKVRLVKGSVCMNHLFFLATCLTTAYWVSAWGEGYRWRWWWVCVFYWRAGPCRQGSGYCRRRCRRKSPLPARSFRIIWLI